MVFKQKGQEKKQKCVEDINRQFRENEIKNADRHIEKYSFFQQIRKYKVKQKENIFPVMI